MKNRDEFNIKEELSKLPDLPGVYLMHAKNNEIIYIGKAKSLKRRVPQYFRDSYKKSRKIQLMVSLIDSFEYIVVDSELEALILESNLIKEKKPRYNTLLKDDKNYPYIELTINEEFPRILSVRRRSSSKNLYYGPYASREQVDEVIDFLIKTYHIRKCRRTFSSKNLLKIPCLYYHMNRCDGPCIGKISEEDYRKNIEKAKRFLDGDYLETLNILKEKMYKASENLAFEEAAEYRDLIESVQAIQNKQKITAYDSRDRDIVGMVKDDEIAVMQIFIVRAGKIIGRDHYYIDVYKDDLKSEILASFIKQYYNGSPYIPSEIWLQEEPSDYKLLEEWLQNEKGMKVKMLFPKKGDKEKLLELAIRNAGILLRRNREKYIKEDEKRRISLLDIKNAAGLSFVPNRIESYDISNISGALNVGSMVVFVNGREKKNDYRKFRIRSVTKPDDYAAMREMLTRRFEHALKENEEDISFSSLPDLILMDGGKGQVGIAEEVLKNLGLRIPVCGMVKDDKHRTRALLYNGIEREISRKSEGFRLMTRIQDEVHRFAIEYHRSLRLKQQVKSILDDVEYIGPTRKKALMRRFIDIDGIKAASFEELMDCDSMNEKAARSLYDFLHVVKLDKSKT